MAERLEQLRGSKEGIHLLRSIAMGVAIILWMVLTSALTWPIASAISGYSGDGIFVTGTIVPAVIIAAVVAFAITRFVFPVSYETSNSASDLPPAQDE